MTYHSWHKRHFISVVVPVRNEVQSIPELAARIDAALAQTAQRWECLWVDDGSTDGTRDCLHGLAAGSPHHRLVRFERGYGQSAALAEGFARARGGVIVTLDGDGQNPPEEIPALVERLVTENLDMVCGYRRRRFSLIRWISSRVANGFRNRMTGERIRDVGCSLRAFRAECVQDLFIFRGMHRFLPTLVRMRGYERIVEVPVDHGPRAAGRTKYGIHNRLWVGIADTFAVRWMIRRSVHGVVVEDSLHWPAVPIAGTGEESD